MSTFPNDTTRHAPFDAIEAYDTKSVGGVLVVNGTPAGRVQITPQRSEISLLLQNSDNVPGPDLRDLANLQYNLHEDAGVMWHRLDVTYDDNLAEVYSVLCTIMDRVQLNGRTFTDAVESVLTGLGDILSGRGGLSHEKQVGLYGELVVLLSLARQLDPSDAVATWRGPGREEHDFGLAHSDVEVKTTMSEQRTHWISSLTQLLPTPGRELHLLSMQITAAGKGPSATLAELVQVAHALPGMPLTELDKSLRAAGYHTRHADLYHSPWALRSRPAFHLVDDEFPALTPNRVAESVPNANHITAVRYRIDLNGLIAADPLFAVTLTGAPET